MEKKRPVWMKGLLGSTTLPYGTGDVTGFTLGHDHGHVHDENCGHHHHHHHDEHGDDCGHDHAEGESCSSAGKKK